MAQPTSPKVKAAAGGAAAGGVAGSIIQIVTYYLTPLVPADIQDPVFFLINTAIIAGLSAAGAFLGGYLKSP
jgi:hypothetical protein